MSELSKLTDISESAIKAHESGQNHIPVPAAEAYARVLNHTPGYILFGEPATSNEARMVPILGEVRAGVWVEIQDRRPAAHEYLPFYDPRFMHIRCMYVLKVEGTSMNELFREGTFVFVVPTIEAGLFEDDVVVVERRRSGTVETTLKQISIGKRGLIELWPRSRDPKYQLPLEIGTDQDEVVVTGVVVGSYRRAPLRTGRVVELAGQSGPAPRTRP